MDSYFCISNKLLIVDYKNSFRELGGERDQKVPEQYGYIQRSESSFRELCGEDGQNQTGHYGYMLTRSQKLPGQYGYILTSKNSYRDHKNSFRCSQRNNNKDLRTNVEKHIDNVHQERKREEEIRKRKTYKVTSLGEIDCSSWLKVIEPNNSFVTQNISSSYLPPVVE